MRYICKSWDLYALRLQAQVSSGRLRRQQGADGFVQQFQSFGTTGVILLPML